MMCYFMFTFSNSWNVEMNSHFLSPHSVSLHYALPHHEAFDPGPLRRKCLHHKGQRITWLMVISLIRLQWELFGWIWDYCDEGSLIFHLNVSHRYDGAPGDILPWWLWGHRRRQTCIAPGHLCVHPFSVMCLRGPRGWDVMSSYFWWVLGQFQV